MNKQEFGARLRFGGLLLASGIGLISSPAQAQSGEMVLPMVQAEGTVLDVTAQGTATRVPDLVTIRAGVVSRAITAAAAMSENAAKMEKILAYLKSEGIANRDISTASVRLNPQYQSSDNASPTITGYEASNSVAVRFRKIADAGAVLDKLVAHGANQIDGPDLSIDKPDEALDEARRDAVAKAKSRADLYAASIGSSVVRVISIAENGENANPGQPRPMMYARVASAQPSTQIAPGEQDVFVTLSVRYLLK